MDADVPVLSATQVNKIFNCQRMWAYEYIEDLKPPLSYSAVKGVFIHSVVERFNKTIEELNLDTEEELREPLLDHIKAKARECWEAGYPGRFESEMREKNQAIHDQLQNYVQTYINRYQQLRNRGFTLSEALQLAGPTTNEHGVTVTDEQGNWIFTGSIDAVYQDHPLWEDRTVLIDYKTGKSPFDSEDPLNKGYERQLDIYGWMYYQAHGEVPEAVGVHFLKESPDSPTAFVFKEIDHGTIERMHLLVQRAQRLLGSDQLEEYPRNTDYIWCEFEKNDGTMIKCDHWDYCLGDEEAPDPEDIERMEFPFDDDPIEVEIKDPLEESLIMQEHRGAHLPRYDVTTDED